jgi:hypothetical protein
VTKANEIVEPVEPAVEVDPQADAQIIYFQFDKETTIEAQVVKEHPDGRVDLIALTDHTGRFKTNISTAANEKVYERVRPGSRFEEGTYWDIPVVEETLVIDDSTKE